MSRLIDADALETHEQLEPLGNGKYEYVEVVYKDDIDAAPTIEERKTGKWIPFEFGDDTWHKCTACGVADNYISIVQRSNGTTGRLESVRNFCPNCGARMEA